MALQAEVQSLKEKLRKQKTSANAASQEQVTHFHNTGKKKLFPLNNS